MNATATQPSEWILLLFFSVLSIGYAWLLLHATRAAIRDFRRARRRTYSVASLIASEAQPSVTVIVPAHQEAASIIPAVHSLLSQWWHQLEVIVIPNGCTDDTMQLLQDEWKLERSVEVLTRPPGARGRIVSTWRGGTDPRLRVIETSGGGKADAVNCGIERASGEFVLLVDADSLLAPHAIASAMMPFIERGDDVAVVSAAIRVLNGARVRDDGFVEPSLPRSLLARMQMVEYARAFHIGRAGWGSMGALPVVSGAFGLFRTSLLRATGGLDVTTVGEDLEIILRIHATARRNGRRLRVEFLPEPLCWTEVPEDTSSLRAQRSRWHRGLVESVHRHGSILFDPRHGKVGLLSFPFLGLFELLAPLVELLGIASVIVAALTGVLSWSIVIVMTVFAVSFGMALSMSAVLLEQVVGRNYVARPSDVLALSGAALLEQFGHRQRTAVWRVHGLLAGLRGSRATWGDMHHRGARSLAHH